MCINRSTNSHNVLILWFFWLKELNGTPNLSLSPVSCLATRFSVVVVVQIFSAQKIENHQISDWIQRGIIECLNQNIKWLDLKSISEFVDAMQTILNAWIGKMSIFIVVAPVEGYMVSIDTFNRFSFESFQVRCLCTLYSMYTLYAPAHTKAETIWIRKLIEWQTKKFLDYTMYCCYIMVWVHRHTHMCHTTFAINN